jgi:hypothetical protein
MQPVGATIWARKTINSEVFRDKPDKWFKIWFYIVSRVNYADNGQYERGECFIQSGEIERETKATPDQVKKCLAWHRGKHSISTRRSTRGIHIKVLKYAIYQDLNNYKSTRKALEKHQRSTTIVEIGKNINNKGGDKSPSLTENKKDMSNWNRRGDDADENVIDLDGDGTIKSTAPSSTKKYPNALPVFKLFLEITGRFPANWKMNRTELQAAENLFTERGLDKIRNALDFYQEHKTEEYCPQISQPSDLDAKWTKLGEFKLKKQP